MKALSRLIVVCLLMALALIVFCPNVHAVNLPIIQMDARNTTLYAADGEYPVCVIDIHKDLTVQTVVFAAECDAAVESLKEDQADPRHQAIIYLTIDGQQINLI